MTFELPKLEYEYNALEPHFDAKTMEIHHSKHHAAYTNKFNEALQTHPDLFEKSAEELVAAWDNLPADVQKGVRNAGGGYVNHKFFWPLLKKGVELKGPIADAINKDFGSFDEFKKQFTAAAGSLFGSGWTWLVVNNNKLEIVNTPNQDSPLADNKIPVLVLDIWEHSYYLKVQNRRPEYIEAFFNIINWDKVNEHFENATK